MTEKLNFIHSTLPQIGEIASLPQALNDRLASGVAGLDEMLGGGLPRGHIVTILGDSGTGKTTFALQYLLEGLRNNEPGIYISLEEEKESILSCARFFGWDLDKYIKEKKLELIKLEPSDIKTTTKRIKSDLPEYLKASGAKRLVIDSITLFGMTFKDEVERRIRLFDLNKHIKKTDITALFTSEVGEGNPYHSRDGIVEYTSDGVLLLQQTEKQKDVRLTIRIIKMRRTAHDRSYRPYEITDRGIVVYPKETVFQDTDMF